MGPPPFWDRLRLQFYFFWLLLEFLRFVLFFSFVASYFLAVYPPSEAEIQYVELQNTFWFSLRPR